MCSVDVSAMSLPANIINGIGNNLDDYLNQQVWVSNMSKLQEKGLLFESESQEAYTARSGKMLRIKALYTSIIYSVEYHASF